MNTSIVTGGAGFIGSHLVRDLLTIGHKVVVLDDLSGGFIENVPTGVEFVRGSITDVALVTALFEKHRPDYVYHLAAYAAEGLSHFIKRFNYENNLIGSVNLINESVKHKVKCFVFTSSVAVYGSLPPPMLETMTPKPEDPYGIAKYAVEQELAVTHEMFGLNYVIFRPHNVYGEFQNLGDKYRNVVGIFMNQLMQGKPLTIFGDGSQRRAFSYVGDITPIIARSPTISGAINQVFNVGADQDYSVKQLATAVMQAMAINGDIRYVEARNEVLNAYSDHSKVRQCFGLSSETPLREGLDRMASWAKRTGVKSSLTFKNIEITEKLPAIWRE